MDKDLNIVTVLRSGGDFRLSDVRLLADNLRTHAGDLNITIYCLSDLVTEEVVNYGIKFIPLRTPKKGWWAKIELFNPNLDRIRPFIYMDLDTAIIGDYSELVPKKKTTFIGVKDFYKPDTDTSSTLMWIPKLNKHLKSIYTFWLTSYEEIIHKYRGDQDYIFDTVPASIYFQDITNIITSFKPNRMWRKALPEKESVICFHGNPRIPVAAKTIGWVNQYVKGEL